MSDTKVEETMTDNGDDDQWLYGDSNTVLDPIGLSAEEIKTKPAEPVRNVEDEVKIHAVVCIV